MTTHSVGGKAQCTSGGAELKLLRPIGGLATLLVVTSAASGQATNKNGISH